MSTPKSLVIPPGVEKVYAIGGGGDIATLSIEARGARRGHVLLIPGWTGSKEDFTPILPLLADAGYDATAYDQRGQYESDPADDYSLKAFAQDAYLADRAGAVLQPRPGTFVRRPRRAAGRLPAPGDMASLSLLCTGPGALGETPGRPPLAPLVQALSVMTLAEIRAKLPRDPSLAPDIAEFLDTRFTSNAPASLQAMTQLLIDAPDIIDEVAATGLPCWVGRGADDDAWPHDVQAAMAKRLGTDVHIVEDAAHSPAVENPQGLIDAWLPFLKENT